MNVGAILLCAGKGERLGLNVPKALAPLADRPLFSHALEALERCAAVESIVVVGPVKLLRDALAASGFAPRKVVAWTEGGAQRQLSVTRGLAAVPAACDMVLVHDCARALIRSKTISRVIADARRYGAAIAAVPLDDTLKRGSLEGIEATIPRAGLWRAQTPQVFRREWLDAAHRATADSKSPPATDDAALVEALGYRVHITQGESLNFKITTPEDLRLAEAALAGRAHHERA